MLASAAEMTGKGHQLQQQQCVVCGANERQYDGKCASCGGELLILLTLMFLSLSPAVCLVAISSSYMI